MHPVICNIGPFTIYAYGLMLAIAFGVSSVAASLQARKQHFDPDTIFNLAFISFVSGIIGARTLYILENIAYFLKNPLEMIMLQHGGLSWFGGLFFGTVFGVAYLKRKRLSIYKTLDLLAPFIALGQAIGRIGCLLNGCCYGKVSRFGIHFASYNATLIPTQLYSSLALFAIFVFLRFLQNRPHREGEIFFAYLLFYSTKRFIIEFWRGDHEAILFGLTLYQIISIGVFLLAFFKLVWIKKSDSKPGLG